MEDFLKIKRHKRKNLFPYILIAPACLLLIVFLAYPLMTVFYYAFQDYSIAKFGQREFAGWSNFIDLFKDANFYKSLHVSLKWVLVEVSVQLVLGMILALLLDSRFRFRSVYRCLVFFPWAVSGVLTSMIWALMYNQNIGVINDLLMKLGIINHKFAWLANTKTVFTSTVIAEVWRGIPFFAITLLAAMQNISSDLHEAAVVDGTSTLKEIFYIKIPLLKDTIILTTLLRAVWEFNNVDVIFTLTGGGPSFRTTTLTMYMTNMSVKNGNYGYGSALAVMAFLILMCFAIIYLKLSRYGKSGDN